MKTKIIYFLLLMSVIAMHSCSKSEPCNAKDIITYYNLTEEQKSKIPYKGSDTLMFLSDAGDTAILWGQGVNHYTEKISTRSLTGDCPDHEYDQIENIETNFIGNNPEFSYLIIKYKAKISGWADDGMFNFGVLLNFNYYSFAHLNFINNSENYKDSLMYLGNHIQGVNLTDERKFFEYFYNFNHGIMRIKVAGGKVWTILKKY
jgi:hypothetical protein